jgi:hypothetical protein
MLADFKLEIAVMRQRGVTQTEIDAMLDRFEFRYALSNENEAALVMALLREAAKSIDNANW